MREKQEMIMSDVRTPTTSMLILTVRFPSPEREKLVPRIYHIVSKVAMKRTAIGVDGCSTNRMDDRILPIMLDWTMEISPSFRALIPTYKLVLLRPAGMMDLEANAYDHLYRITESGIDQASSHRTNDSSELLSRKG